VGSFVKKYSRTKMLPAVLLAGGILLAIGCKDDENPVLVGSQPPTEPRSANELVSRFLAAYEAKNVDKYLARLDPAGWDGGFHPDRERRGGLSLGTILNWRRN
jgi:hypothetical protein